MTRTRSNICESSKYTPITTTAQRWAASVGARLVHGAHEGERPAAERGRIARVHRRHVRDQDRVHPSPSAFSHAGSQKHSLSRNASARCASLIAGCAAGSLRPPDVRYEPTPMDVVGTMLELTAIRTDDVVADLGCGDGRIVIEAVRRGAARGPVRRHRPAAHRRGERQRAQRRASPSASPSSTRTCSPSTCAASRW